MKISTKVALSNIVLGTTCVLAVMATVLVQHNRLRHEAENLARLSAGDQALQVAQTVLKNCIATENRNQRRLEHSLESPETSSIGRALSRLGQNRFRGRSSTNSPRKPAPSPCRR